MGLYETIKDGLKLVQVSNDAALTKNFMDIQQGYMVLVEELDDAKRYIKELENRLENKKKLVQNPKGYYEEENGVIQYCSRCYEVDNKVVTLIDKTRAYTIYHECPNCNSTIKKERIPIR